MSDDRRFMKLMCLNCKTVIHSLYYGHFNICKCGDISIDETEEYIRILGDKNNYCEVEVE